MSPLWQGSPEGEGVEREMAMRSTRCISLLLLGVMLLGLGGSVRANEASTEEQFRSPMVQSVAGTASFSPALTGADCRAAGLPEMACTGVSSNDEWTPVIREFDGVPMALVPAGCFTMGSTDEQINYAMDVFLDRRSYYEDEQPAHQQCFAEPFWIDVYEVTNEQYGSYDVRPGDDLPRDYISWFDSAAHCESRGVRLPSEAEWEYAARGPDSLIFPWGNEFDNTLLNYCDINCGSPGADSSASDGYALTGPVGSYPEGASWVGALDMAGNLWEWTSGLPYDYPYRADDGREVDSEKDSSSFRTLRGGAWIDSAFALRSANRNRHAPVDQATLFGFRCAGSFGTDRDAVPEETPATPAEEFAFSAADCLTAGLPEIACTGTSANSDWTPVIREFNGVPMALVPAGCFLMGNDDGFDEEQPVHDICFNQSFWIGLTEVTVAQFTQFLNGQDEPIDDVEGWIERVHQVPPVPVQLIRQEHGWVPVPGHGKRPLQSVTRNGADAYCAWRAARLPTEAEWEYAARGPDSLLYPWGNEFIADNVLRVYERARLPNVGSKPQGASWVGALDLSGSLFEWASSLYRPYPYDAGDGREVGLDVDDSGNRVLRGSAWYHSEGMHDNVSATARFDAPPHHTAWYFGFRCARPFDESDGKAQEEPEVGATYSRPDCQEAGMPPSYRVD